MIKIAVEIIAEEITYGGDCDGARDKEQGDETVTEFAAEKTSVVEFVNEIMTKINLFL